MTRASRDAGGEGNWVRSSGLWPRSGEGKDQEDARSTHPKRHCSAVEKGETARAIDPFDGLRVRNRRDGGGGRSGQRGDPKTRTSPRLGAEILRRRRRRIKRGNKNQNLPRLNFTDAAPTASLRNQ